MLDASSLFTLGVPAKAFAFADSESPGRYYVVPAEPRLAADERGRPLISFLVYRRGTGEQQVIGGQLTLTTTLALSAGELSAMQALVAQQPRGEAGAGEIQLVSPDWAAGEVKVRVTEGIELSGRPSMLSSNECTLIAWLTPEQVRLVEGAWKNGLPDLKVSYEVKVWAVQPRRAAMERLYDLPPGAHGRGRLSFDLLAGESVEHPLSIEGKLSLTPEQLQAALQAITI